MANSIRPPRQGVTANSRRIAEAVDDEEWQKVRLSMKGISTEEKIDVLVDYYEEGSGSNFSGHINKDGAEHFADGQVNSYDCDVCIRIDNYIKALCRGGQLQAGVGIDDLLRLKDYIKK
jgi:hypothetical protein